MLSVQIKILQCLQFDANNLSPLKMAFYPKIFICSPDSTSDHQPRELSPLQQAPQPGKLASEIISNCNLSQKKALPFDYVSYPPS